MTILNKEQQKNLILIAIVSSLLTQITHASDLFSSISKVENQYLNTFLSYVFAFGLELSIFIFTLKAKKATATFFALISFLINILYYYPKWEISRECLSSLVISLIVPVAIWFYSDLILEEIESEQLEEIYNKPEPIQEPIVESVIEKVVEQPIENNIIQFEPTNEPIVVQQKIKKEKKDYLQRFDVLINEETNKYYIKRKVAGRVSSEQIKLEMEALVWFNENRPLEAKPINIENIEVNEPEKDIIENVES
jgi:hypothetical protein